MALLLWSKAILLDPSTGKALDTYIDGAFALEQGFIFSAMILAGITVYIIERKFRQAAYWSAIAAVISWVGLMHSYRWTVADTVVNLGWGTGAPWAIGYIMLAILFFYVDWQERVPKLLDKSKQ